MPTTSRPAPLAIIRLALVGSVVSLGAVVALLHRPPTMNPSSIEARLIGYALAASALGAVVVALLLRGRVAVEPNEAKRQSLLIATWAAGEAPGLLGGVAFMLTGQWIWFAIGLLAMLIAMLLSPIRD
jgi:hypothetical protein